MFYFSFLEGKIGVQILKNKGFSGGSVVKNLPSMQESQETWVWSLGQEGPLEKEVATHPTALA